MGSPLTSAGGGPLRIPFARNGDPSNPAIRTNLRNGISASRWAMATDAEAEGSSCSPRQNTDSRPGRAFSRQPSQVGQVTLTTAFPRHFVGPPVPLFDLGFTHPIALDGWAGNVAHRTSVALADVIFAAPLRSFGMPKETVSPAGRIPPHSVWRHLHIPKLGSAAP